MVSGIMTPEKAFILLCIFVACVFGKRPDEHKNRTPTTTGRTAVGDVVVEKFVETLMASERYWKQIESVERKLNHLDATFHEKTNSIMKYLSEMLRMVKSSPAEMLEKALIDMKTDLDRLKQSVTTRLDEHPSMRGKCLHLLSYVFDLGLDQKVLGKEDK